MKMSSPFSSLLPWRPQTHTQEQTHRQPIYKGTDTQPCFTLLYNAKIHTYHKININQNSKQMSPIILCMLFFLFLKQNIFPCLPSYFCPFFNTLTGGFCMYFIQHCFICHPSGPGLLRLWHGQSDAVPTRLDLIHKSARSHLQWDKSHPQLG